MRILTSLLISLSASAISCDGEKVKDAVDPCFQNLQVSIGMTKSLAALDNKLSRFQIQPECSSCPREKATCPDDTAVLQKGAEALREMEEVHAMVRNYRRDPQFSIEDLTKGLYEMFPED